MNLLAGMAGGRVRSDESVRVPLARTAARGVDERQRSYAWHRDRPAIAAPWFLGTRPSPAAILPLQRLAGNAAVGELLAIQRQAVPSKVPPLSCPVSTGPPPEVGTAVIFATGGATVDPDLEKVISAFVAVWNRVRMTRPRQVGDELVVDGYASTTGSQKRNWLRSCQRAEAVCAVLIAKGVPGSSIRVFAHGETNLFDPASLRNQRAVISPVNPVGWRGTVSLPPTQTFPGLDARKQALVSSGGHPLDLAVAMLETEHMDAADHPFGDGKTLDAANFGIFKQNWHFIRKSGAMPRVPTMRGGGLRVADWLRGSALNTNLALDVRVLHASQASLGLDQWFAAHRWGETGQRAFQAAASGRTTAAQRATLSDIGNYRDAVEWILAELVRDPVLQTDDRKVFVQVPAV